MLPGVVSQNPPHRPSGDGEELAPVDPLRTRTGKAQGDGELELMSQVARWRFTHFSDAEIRALRAFRLFQ
jgi:hypothetical protein